MSAITGPASTAHTPRVVAVSAIAVLLAFLLQTAGLPALGLSAAVPVVFVVVAVLATALGSRAGSMVGFGAGLLLDLTGAGVIGVGALIGCLLGAAAGRIRVDRWAWSGMLPVWSASVLAAGAFTVANAVVEGLSVTWSGSWLWMAAGALVCTAGLLPLRPWVREVVR